MEEFKAILLRSADTVGARCNERKNRSFYSCPLFKGDAAFFAAGVENPLFISPLFASQGGERPEVGSNFEATTHSVWLRDRVKSSHDFTSASHPSREGV